MKRASPRYPRRIGAALLATSLLAPTLAQADAIDGDWCREGKNLRIEGPLIITETGEEVFGDYHRHGFRYVVPEGNPDAGVVITITQHSEELMTLVRSSDGAPESWNRCAAIS